jgi:hypothetical protein
VQQGGGRRNMIKTYFNNLNLSSIGNLKYPTSRTEYAFHTGELGEYAIRTIIKDILSNIDIPEHNVKVNGSDIQIFYNGKLMGKFEVLNLDSKSYMNSKRALSIKQNLKGVKYKGVICSFFNATSKAKKILKNIPVCTIGFQLLPSKFHQYYARLNKVHHRKIANNKSLKQLKNTLKSFFHRIGLDLLMYVSRTSRSRMYVSNTIKLSNTSFKNSSKNIETENRRAITEQKTESLTSNDNIDVEREQFLNETLSRYPSLKKNKIRSSKECPNRRYKILVCPLKVFRPRYMCSFRVLYLKRHQKFPSCIENYGKVYVCQNPKCTGEKCECFDLSCSYLVEINKCPRMYKPPHFCLPLPKPKTLPSPDLTYYLNLKQNDVMK